ncbi:MAG: hypothetical protein CMH85_12515 [Novosphingobium sp.]|jgi:hypothetical protein|uniref:Uncharacterized protein n=1 Tax=Novosphingobium indicum TaxID=462949 RepID=A0ABQ2J8C3_9SPHN|nr:hypothetical protein [Novosphingobium indicum]MAC59069.1 hypothetical protein [Novosphingobium sp.]GGN40450.1 hypothetical protein GCM10011349_01370 [Novosphingobium indicum]|tara:strand:- start:195 stop:512 length:318 start_codon:yes stop_codon:yes gene_type:complete
MTERTDDLAPETVNAEQQDANTQAQAVADQAMTSSLSVLGLEQSEKLSNSLNPAATQDLVDHMKQMDTSGTIDMSAYRGEETMDDLENRYGRAAVADDYLAHDDS